MRNFELRKRSVLKNGAGSVKINLPKDSCFLLYTRVFIKLF